MLHPSTKKLIDRLAETAEHDRMKWTQNTNDELVYESGGYRLILTREPNELIIKTVDDTELERVTSHELTKTSTDSGTSYTDILASITREAERNACGTTTAISVLLNSISSHEDQGFRNTPITTGIPEPEQFVHPDDIVDNVDTQYHQRDTTTARAITPNRKDQSQDPSGPAGKRNTGSMQHTAEDDMTYAIARLANEVNRRVGPGVGQPDRRPLGDTKTNTTTATPPPASVSARNHKPSSFLRSQMPTSTNKSYVSDDNRGNTTPFRSPSAVSPRHQASMRDLRQPVPDTDGVSSNQKPAARPAVSASLAEAKSRIDALRRQSATVKKDKLPPKPHEHFKLWE